jgi:hypothetical protein
MRVIIQDGPGNDFDPKKNESFFSNLGCDFEWLALNSMRISSNILQLLKADYERIGFPEDVQK